MTLSEMLGQATKENNLLRQQLQHAYAELQAAQEKEDQPEVFLSLSQRPQSL